MIRLLTILLFTLFAAAAFAQAPVQQSPTKLDAAGNIFTANSAGTTNITPPSGQYVYVTAVDIANCAGTAVTAAAPTNITTTNLNGATWMLGSGSTAGICQPNPSAGAYANPIKSAAAGTAVGITVPALVTQQNVRINIYYYTAP